MLRWQIKILRISYMVLDSLALAISIPLAAYLANYLSFQKELFQSPLEIYGFISISYVCFVAFFLLANLYDTYMSSRSLMSKKLALKTIITYLPGHFLSYLLLAAILPGYTYIFHLLFTILFLFISTLIRVVNYAIRSNTDQDPGKKRNVLIVGQSSKGAHYIEIIRKYAYLQYNIIGYVHIKESQKANPSTNNPSPIIEARLGSEYGNSAAVYRNEQAAEPFHQGSSIYKFLQHLGGLEDLPHIVNEHVVDELVVTRPLSYDDRLESTLEMMQQRGITITMLLNRVSYNTADAIATMIEDIPALKFHTVSLHEGQLVAKRVLDIIGALVGLFLYAVAWIIFAPLIKLESKGPVLFKQDRVGKNGRIFKIAKFRSMCDDAEAKKKDLKAQNEVKGHMFKITNDPRVTRVGKLIRKTSIDELPQFINVFKGEMSLVGTRPPTIDEVKEYQIHHYKRISVIPGITGLWQVSGRSAIKDFEKVVQLDNQYISNWSIGKDIKIILQTILIMILTLKPASSKEKLQELEYESAENKSIPLSRGIHKLP